MRELLIRYLLGELDFHEQRQLEERLRSSSELQRELAYLRTCFAAARDSDQRAQDLPLGLAERTTQHVADFDSEEEPCSRSSSIPNQIESTAEPQAGALGWSLADLTVAGGVILAVSMLVFPALRDSREVTRANYCQHNQQQMYVLLAGWAEDNGGYFPRIMPDENAGMFTVRLVESGMIRAEDLAMLLVCPGSPAAQAIRNGGAAVRIPTPLQLAMMSHAELLEARKHMSPSFAYALPYRSGERYVYRRVDHHPFPLILSDASGSEPGQTISPNHHGFFQALGGDGSVRMFESCRVPGFGNDDVYRNAFGVVAAGCDPGDMVLGPSEATPAGIEPIARPRRFGE
jgi:hypothetical protein